MGSQGTVSTFQLLRRKLKGGYRPPSAAAPSAAGPDPAERHLGRGETISVAGGRAGGPRISAPAFDRRSLTTASGVEHDQIDMRITVMIAIATLGASAQLAAQPRGASPEIVAFRTVARQPNL